MMTTANNNHAGRAALRFSCLGIRLGQSLFSAESALYARGLVLALCKAADPVLF